jgi:hypothetical protein
MGKGGKGNQMLTYRIFVLLDRIPILREFHNRQFTAVTSGVRNVGPDRIFAVCTRHPQRYQN